MMGQEEMLGGMEAFLGADLEQRMTPPRSNCTDLTKILSLAGAKPCESGLKQKRNIYSENSGCLRNPESLALWGWEPRQHCMSLPLRPLFRDRGEICVTWGFPGGSAVKNSPVDAGAIEDVDSVPGSGRSPGEENGNLLQCSSWDNPMNRGACGVHGVVKCQTQLSN